MCSQAASNERAHKAGRGLSAHHDSAAEISHSISDGIVHIVYRGALGAEDMIRAREQFLADAAFRPGMSFLVDFRGASLRSMSTEDLRRVGVHGAEVSKGWGDHRSAVVVATDLDYGLSRMFSVLGDRPGLELRIFRDASDARDWLATAASEP